MIFYRLASLMMGECRRLILKLAEGILYPWQIGKISELADVSLRLPIFELRSLL